MKNKTIYLSVFTMLFFLMLSSSVSDAKEVGSGFAAVATVDYGEIIVPVTYFEVGPVPFYIARGSVDTGIVVDKKTTIGFFTILLTPGGEALRGRVVVYPGGLLEVQCNTNGYSKK